jgi:hypothetical protein
MRATALFLATAAMILAASAVAAGPDAGAPPAPAGSANSPPTSTGSAAPAPAQKPAAATKPAPAQKPAASPEPPKSDAVSSLETSLHAAAPTCNTKLTAYIAQNPAADLSTLTAAVDAAISGQQTTMAALRDRNKAAADAQAQRCSDNLVLCVDDMGHVDSIDALPLLAPADVLQVDVVGTAADAASLYSLHFNVKQVNESVTAPLAGTAPQTGQNPNVRTETTTPADVLNCLNNAFNIQQQAAKNDAPAVLASAKTDPIDASDLSITVWVVRQPSAAGAKDGFTTSYEMNVDPGRYYVDLGVMIPFTVDRSIQTVTDIASGQNRLAVKWNARIVPAFVINIYPGGRARGRVSSGDGPNISANLWGIQAGTGLAFTNRPFGEFYLGGLLTPISGLSFSIGAALINEQVLRTGEVTGMLLRPGATYTPDTRYMLWPYVGFSATLDFLDVLRQGVARATTGSGGSK